MADSHNLPKDFKGYKLQSLEELCEVLDYGMQVNFFLRGVWYLMEKYYGKALIATCPDGDGVTYDSFEVLFAEHMIDERPLGEQWQEFEIESM